jgi:hypothetical protein
MENFTTPLDLFGSLVTPRRDGESLADYRERVVAVAENLAHRDAASGEWASRRAAEIAGHTGYPTELVSGYRDAELVARAFGELLTYGRLDTWTGPFRWAEAGAPGEPPLYSRGHALRGGVASVADLAPSFDPTTGSYYATSGTVVSPGADGGRYYVAGHFNTVSHRLLAGTTQTVLLPYQIGDGVTAMGAPVAGHGHRVEVVDRDTVRLVGPDHTHLARVDDFGVLQIDPSVGGTVHTHSARPVQPHTTTLLYAGPDDPVVGDEDAWGRTITGSGLGPIDGTAASLFGPEGVTVTTVDGAHTSWVDPHSYWSGTFTIGDERGADGAHVHRVENWVVQPGGDDDHTHVLTGGAPTVPQWRPLVPVLASYEGADYATPVAATLAESPFVARVSVVDGWTVVENGHGLGDRLTMAYPADDSFELPTPAAAREGDVWGLGPDVPASRVVFTEVSADVSATGLRVGLRSEDAYTGGVSGQTVELVVVTSDTAEAASQTFVYEGVTDDRAEATVTLSLGGLSGRGLVTVTARLLDVDGVVVDTAERVVDLDAMRPGTYGYGVDYGVARP